jgi:hypothetical protein
MHTVPATICQIMLKNCLSLNQGPGIGTTEVLMQVPDCGQAEKNTPRDEKREQMPLFPNTLYDLFKLHLL